MIAVKLMGGLGNQMFQYAIGRRTALSRHTKLVLDLSHYDNQPAHEVPRYFELDCFDIKAKLVREPVEKTGMATIFLRGVKPNVIKEDGLGFKSGILNSPNNSLLIGHWASEKYFIDKEKQIRQDFRFAASLSNSKQKVADEIKGVGQPVSIQIRRGDFVSHPGSNRFHGIVPLSYYRQAVAEITKNIKSPTFFVISDDPGWCKKNIKLTHPTIFVDHIPGTGHEDMNLMSQCLHHIIANSTFGWWGAWLNSNRQKIVVSPATWVKDKSIDTSDLLPKSWIKLDP